MLFLTKNFGFYNRLLQPSACAIIHYCFHLSGVPLRRPPLAQRGSKPARPLSKFATGDRQTDINCNSSPGSNRPNSRAYLR